MKRFRTFLAQYGISVGFLAFSVLIAILSLVSFGLSPDLPSAGAAASAWRLP